MFYNENFVISIELFDALFDYFTKCLSAYYMYGMDKHLKCDVNFNVYVDICTDAIIDDSHETAFN